MARSSATLFYDADLGVIVMWGGTIGSVTTDQTWEFHDSDWTELFPEASPPAGDPRGGAYDSAFGYGMIFGPTGQDNSTWIYTGGTWTNFTATFGPSSPPTPAAGFPGRTNPLAYDSTDGYTVELNVEVVVNQSTFKLEVTANQTWLLRDPLTLNATDSATVRDVGQNLTFEVSVIGGIRPYQFNISTLPSGCVAPPNIVSATTFTCRPSQAGPFDANFNVIDTLGTSVDVLLPLTVYPALSPTATVSRNRTTVGITDEFQGTAIGGDPPVVSGWTTTDGAVSGGLDLNHSFSAPGIYVATFTTSDAVGAVVTVNVTVEVNPGLVISANANASMTDVGLPVEFNSTATGGPVPWRTRGTLGMAAYRPRT